MNLASMRFKGVKWRHNPRELSFVCDRYISESGMPSGGSLVQTTGRKGLRVKGKGTLFGDDCMEQFERLYSLFTEGGCGILSIARLSPIYAAFESLKITGKPKPDMLDYEFVFREYQDKTSSPKPVTAKPWEGECLWDISYRFGVPVETLLELNPSVMRPDLPLGTEAVILC